MLVEQSKKLHWMDSGCVVGEGGRGGRLRGVCRVCGAEMDLRSRAGGASAMVFWRLREVSWGSGQS